MEWYNKIDRQNGIINLPDCIDHFNQEYENARKEINLRGKRLEQVSKELPGIFEYRFAQLQEIEAILEWLNIELRRVKSTVFQKHMMASNRALSSRDAEKYTEGDREYVDMAIIVTKFALVRNRFLSITKGLDQVSWQIGHIVRLRCNGLDDASLT